MNTNASGSKNSPTQSLSPGIRGFKEITVTHEETAERLLSGQLPVYATPSMIALMEYTCFASVGELLPEGMGTVGTLVNVRHLAATPVGMKVSCESELLEADGLRLVFSVRAYDECGTIGEGTHERFIVSSARFMEKAAKKTKTPLPHTANKT